MIYSEEILEHYRNPQNFRALAQATHETTLNNPLCGDVIRLMLEVKNGKVKEVAFQGSGCAISRASASLFTEYLRGKEVASLRNLDKKSTIDIVGFNVSAGRIKCLLLPFEALKNLLKQIDS